MFTFNLFINSPQPMGSKSVKQLPSATLHIRALGPAYTGTSVEKVTFDARYIPWDVPFQGYQPVNYTAPRVLEAPDWADPDIRRMSLFISSFLM